MSLVCPLPLPLWGFRSSGNGEAAGSSKIAGVSTEESLEKYFSFFEGYCTNKTWLHYMYCVFQQYGLLASAARDMPIGTSAHGSSPGPPTSVSRTRKRRSAGGGVEAVKIKKSKEGKKLEKAKRQCAELTVVSVKAQLLKDLEQQHSALSTEIKNIKGSGEEVSKFKSLRLQKLEKDLEAALKSGSDSEGSSDSASESASDSEN